MRPEIAVALLLGLVGPSAAQVVQQPGPPTPTACAYNSSPPTLTDALAGWMQCDSAGNLRVTGTVATSGTTAATQSGTWTVQPGNTANTTPWLVTPIPSAAAGAGLTSSQTGAAATNLAVSGAHNLYGLQITTAGSAGRAMLFDATALPVNGAVTPKKCWSLAATSTTTISWDTPIANATGITVGFSTGADCYTLTAANAEFIAVDYK
jgi:hypothetical protein